MGSRRCASVRRAGRVLFVGQSRALTSCAAGEEKILPRFDLAAHQLLQSLFVKRRVPPDCVTSAVRLAAGQNSRIQSLGLLSSRPQQYGEGMTVEAIKEAIAGLPAGERHSLAMWLNEMEYDSWDKQMAADFSAGGRGAALVEKVRREVAEGRAMPFEEGSARARPKRNPPRQ